MGLADRLDQLEPRERQLLSILLGVFVLLIIFLFPVGVSAMLGGKRDDNQAMQEAIQSIHDGREKFREKRKAADAVIRRYTSPAPPLAGFLDKLAKSNGLEIPESQDRAEVPHGKIYVERSTKIVLKRVQMLNFVKFMEEIEQSGHPVSITRMNIRKRGTEVDSFDVEMVVSAFDRKPPKKKTVPAEEVKEEE